MRVLEFGMIDLSVIVNQVPSNEAARPDRNCPRTRLVAGVGWRVVRAASEGSCAVSWRIASAWQAVGLVHAKHTFRLGFVRATRRLTASVSKPSTSPNTGVTARIATVLWPLPIEVPNHKETECRN